MARIVEWALTQLVMLQWNRKSPSLGMSCRTKAHGWRYRHSFSVNSVKRTVSGCCVHRLWVGLISSLVHGWTLSHETPLFRPKLADPVRTYTGRRVCHRCALAGAQFFIGFFNRLYRGAARHLHYCEPGLGRMHILCSGCPPAARVGSTSLTAPVGCSRGTK